MSRAQYKWGKSVRVRSLDVGESFEVDFLSRNDYSAWRSIVSNCGKIFGAKFSVLHNDANGKIIITRTR